jgi:hypothetical protein
MSFNIVLTTAEDIVAVVDAVCAKDGKADKDFISQFTGIATDDQVQKATHMAIELNLLKFNSTEGTYSTDLFLANKLVMAKNDEQKAAVMKIVLEEYEPYKVFKLRYERTNSIELACRQMKIMFGMSSNERDIKNTIVSVATYAKALKSEGANLYSFTNQVDDMKLLGETYQGLFFNTIALKRFFGDNLLSRINEKNVQEPLVEAMQKASADVPDAKSVIVYAANAFESFLNDYAVEKNVSLQGKNGILQKRDALSAVLSKKHRGMIDYIGQIRNAADHGADNDENGQMWSVSNETANIYPSIVAILIRDILLRDNGIIEV